MNALFNLLFLTLSFSGFFHFSDAWAESSYPTKKDNQVINTPGATPSVSPIIMSKWYSPPLQSTWHWQLKGKVKAIHKVDVYDIDLFDTPISLIQQIQSSGSKVFCYFSAGSFEDWRGDKNKFKPENLGSPLDDWPGEKWLDIRSPSVHVVMKDRLDLAKKKGCDGVEPDNVDAYANKSGFDLSATDQLTYNRFIANEAHARGLSVGLKNDLEQVEELHAYFDFSVNEQCFEYSECNALIPFIQTGKPVFNAEYQQKYIKSANQQKKLCAKSKKLKFSTLILPLELDHEFRLSCL